MYILYIVYFPCWDDDISMRTEYEKYIYTFNVGTLSLGVQYIQCIIQLSLTLQHHYNNPPPPPPQLPPALALVVSG